MTQDSSVPRIVVYCDESCHDLTPRHSFMAIGGLWLPSDRKPGILGRLKRLCRSLGLLSEIKWRKTSSSRLKDYQRLVDFFFEEEDLRFRTIVVEQARVRLSEFHGMDKELAFYKFYYEMLAKWLAPGSEYLILLDQKQNKGADRYATLRRVLERHIRGSSWIADLTVIDSSQTLLAQLCDLLTGSVAAAYNGPRPGSPKELLGQYIARLAGMSSLKASTSLSESKFNIFRIDLGDNCGV